MIAHAVDEQGLSVLVVEDDVDAADSYMVLLGLFGHRVRTAGDGPTALRLAAEDAPDVALIDISLPGLDGYQVARALACAAGRRPLLVAITGYGSADDVRRSYLAGFDLHITKPVEPDALRELLRRFGRVIAPAVSA